MDPTLGGPVLKQQNVLVTIHILSLQSFIKIHLVVLETARYDINFLYIPLTRLTILWYMLCYFFSNDVY